MCCSGSSKLFAFVEASENKSATGIVAAGYEPGVLYKGLGTEQILDQAIALIRKPQRMKEDAINALVRLNMTNGISKELE